MESADTASTNARLSACLVEACSALGVTDICLCAGARNAPLVVALTTAENPPWRLWHFFDERAAAFFALGCSASGGLGAVVTTSGTAAAELLPALIEARCSGLPLLAITADRPSRFRGSVAPQAIDQVGLYGSYVESCLDIECAAGDDAGEVLKRILGGHTWRRRAPWHWNVCFDEPLLGSGGTAQGAVSAGFDFLNAKPEHGADESGVIESWLGANRGRLLVLLGGIEPGKREALIPWLARLGAPIWAEASSGLRECQALEPWLLSGGEAALRGWKPGAVLRLGDVPSARAWRDLEDQPEVPVLSISRAGWSGLARPSTALRWTSLPGCGALADGSALLERGRESGERLEQALRGHPWSEPAIFRALSEAIPSEAKVFLGNSLPIREWNLAASRRVAHPHVWASRGANGIDGQVATWLGLSTSGEESWGIFGDITALYDLNAPWVLPQLPAGRRTLVVVNNGGGRIFSRVLGLARLPEGARRITENRHARSFADWARLWDMDYHLVARGPKPPLAHLPWADPGRLRLVEIQPDENETEAFWEAWSA